MGVGDALGFGGNVSPAKLALVHGLAEGPDAADRAAAADGATQVLELRLHGVGGSSPEQILEHDDYVQVGGDDLALFIRRWGSRRRIVPWPLEGYWWGGMTSAPATRALWSLLLPLLFCNLAAWCAPASPGNPPPARRLLPLAGCCLAVTMRWAGYVLTLVLTASVATASIGTFGWQCTGPADPGSCRVSWLSWMPLDAGRRMTLFAFVPVVVVAVLWFAGHKTLNAYERWRIQTGQAPAGSASTWPLTAEGFWHGLRPVKRMQLLHLAGVGGLISLYLAWVPSSHPAWHTAAVSAALVMIGAAGLLLASPEAGRPGVNPYTATDPPAQAPSFDRMAGMVLVVSLTLLAALLLARLWWHPVAPPAAGYPGSLPGDAGIWEGLSIAMGVLIIVAFALTGTAKAVIARAAPGLGASQDRDCAGSGDAQPAAKPTGTGQLDSAPFRPFTGGFLGPSSLCLACVTGGIFAAGVNLAVPRLLIGSGFKVGPGWIGGQAAAEPIQVPWPLFSFMTALVALAAALFLILCYAVVRYFMKRAAIMELLGGYYADAASGSKAQRRRIAGLWTLSRAVDLIGLTVGVLAVAGFASVFAFYAVNPQSFPAWLISFAQALTGAAAVALYGFTLSAFRNRSKRTMIQALWDVGTYWPRACQPFAPPCYMERSAPELVNRLNGLLAPANDGAATRLTADLAARLGPGINEKALASELGELTPRYHRILLNGYSQGSPIAAAAIAQLPRAQADAISLITVGSPLRRLYGRGFPAYFGPDRLAEMGALLGGPEKVRWRNAVRKSDYIGDYVFHDPYGKARLQDAGPVDKAVLDPPCVVPGDGDGVTLPPIHGHSDFWPDPQVAVLTRSLIGPGDGHERSGQPTDARCLSLRERLMRFISHE